MSLYKDTRELIQEYKGPNRGIYKRAYTGTQGSSDRDKRELIEGYKEANIGIQGS